MSGLNDAVCWGVLQLFLGLGYHCEKMGINEKMALKVGGNLGDGEILGPRAGVLSAFGFWKQRISREADGTESAG
jgi:hypothetical protein